MRFACKRKDLTAALSTVNRAVTGRSVLEILHNVLIEASGESVTLTATDLEVGIRTTFPAQVGAPGQITVPARALSDIASSLSGNDVTLTLGDRNDATLGCGKSTYTLLGLLPEEFPALPVIETAAAVFAVPQRVLHGMIRQTAIAVSDDDTRPVLTGIETTLTGNCLRMAATDTHRLATRSCEVTPDDAAQGTLVIPGRALAEVLRALSPESDEAVRVCWDGNQVSFHAGAVTLVSRLLEGQFPKWERVVPTTHTRSVTVSVSELHKTVKRAFIVAKEAENRVHLRTDGDTLLVQAQAGDLGQAYEEIEAETTGDAIEVVFNGRYLLDLLSVLEGDRVVMELTEPLSPALFRPEGGTNFYAVVMPMQDR